MAGTVRLTDAQIEHPERVPGFITGKQGKFKFAILCSGQCHSLNLQTRQFTHMSTTGFISDHQPHRLIYGAPPDLPSDLPSLHSILFRRYASSYELTVCQLWTPGIRLPVSLVQPHCVHSSIIRP
jgi:hypothetical protein